MSASDSPSTRPSLLVRLRNAADAEAWAEFDHHYGPLIVRYCKARGLQVADAEDVRQDVMLRLSGALRNFEYDPARGRFRDYLGRVVRNAILRWRERDAARRRGTAEFTQTTVVEEVAENLTDAAWDHEWLMHHYRMAMAVVRSTRSQRSIAVFDRLIAGEAVEAVAAQFSLTAPAVRKIKQRLLEQVSELVAAQMRAEQEVDV